MVPPRQEGGNRHIGGAFGRGGLTRGRGARGARGEKDRASRGDRGGRGISDRGIRGHEPRQDLRQTEDTPVQQRAKADYNAWKRLIKNPPKANDIRTIEVFWSSALAILDGDDRDWKQMLPRDLEDKDNYGRQHIHMLLNMVAHPHGNRTFIDLAKPFLLVITHRALLDCLSVDNFVGGLYSVFSGTNGCRAIPFFQHLGTRLLGEHLEPTGPDSRAVLEKTFIAMSAALRELLRREQRAAFHEDLPNLVNSMEHIAETTGIGKHYVVFQVARIRIAEFRRMVARANGLLYHEEERQVSGASTTTATSTYPRDIAAPRDRHDNDKTDITKIKILPTEGEIRSNQPAFLPSTDFDRPHFLTDQVERYLDTYFRLFRHDVLGELSEALGGLLVALENNSTLLENPKLSLDNIRAYSNPKAHITYISFDQRRGMEAQISFPQPSNLHSKSPSERRNWWEESKRLEEGILLCLLFVNGIHSSLLFFTVSEKCTDMKKEHGLCSVNHQATIKAKLATQSQNDMELMTRLSCQNIRGLLIELPDILLATFVPILENIQNMQRLSRLPFRQWILPDRVPPNGDVSRSLDIPPPLYSRDPGFAFSLQPILKDAGDDLFLNPTTSLDSSGTMDVLEARTQLDRGQCQALIAALTREFAFIQGPPGTGKSYLGVQLMRVLLACKMKADLGPVVVV